MNTDNTIASFITGYGPELRGMICFAWNQKHAAEFHDENDVFRQQVIAAVLAEPYKAGLDLVGDLFEAEAHWSKEAWCIRNSFSKLGSILLRRGGAAQLDRFLEWFAVSFDAYSECHAMSLDPITLAPLISEVDRRLANTVDERQKARLEMAQKLFAKHKSGDPLKGMMKLDPSDLGKAKVVSRSDGLWAKIASMFGKK